MSIVEEIEAEQQIAIPVRVGLDLIKQEVLAYRGDNPKLKKLNLKAKGFESEAVGRKGSFPMEKLMGLIRKLKAKSSDPEVALFLNDIKAHIDIVTSGIQQLVERNLGLVGLLVNKFLGHDKSYSREDRLQDGNTGLVKAAYRFDPKRKIKFSTYACWWIKQEARLGYMSMARTIRWPSNIYQAMGKGEDVFLAAMGRNSGVVFAATCKAPVSLNDSVGEATEPLANSIEAPNSVSVEDLVVNRQVADIVSSSIDSVLTPREALVIRARFGIDEKSDHILADIGRMLGVSPERIRHIESDALLKLKKCVNMSKLQENYA